ncbi:MAG: prephenate dehydratase [Chloroflexi bacterium]|nr:prephenate dehydratase [Chloroflexota bacterium]
MGKRLGFLGPAGTYSEEAAVVYDRGSEKVMFASIGQVTEAVERGAIEEAIVPIENSLQGSVPEVLDFLIRTPKIKICNELAIRIRNCLMVKPGTRREHIRKIYSHPQPLGQCRRYLAQNFPNVEPVAALSTASAVTDMLASDVPAAAIAPRRAGELYGAEIIAEDIQDRQNNFTRFVVLAPADNPRTGRDKTSIAFSFDKDQPGLLYAVIGAFARRGINLTKVESRPTGEELGRYVFLVDLEGHRTDKVVIEALGEVGTHTSMLKTFGSYPVFDLHKTG